MVEDAPTAATKFGDPAHRRVLRYWADATAEVVGEAGDRLLHWDLHFENVLSAEREPWLAIDPKPLLGHPDSTCCRRWTTAGTRPSPPATRSGRSAAVTT